MRLLSSVLLSSVLLGFFSLSAFAAEPAALPPPALSTGPDTSPSDEPAVTITKQTDLTIEEYRSGGRVYMIKVTPKVGPPYYLVDSKGDGKYARQESLDSGIRPPQWVIHRF